MTATGFIDDALFAASAGLATFFAPCAFPLLPGYVGYYMGRGGDGGGSSPAVQSAVVAALGSLVALGAVAGAVFAAGRTLTSVLPLLEPVVGALLVVFGLLVLSGRSPSATVGLTPRPESLLGFGVFGAAYAVAAAGCVVPLVFGVAARAVSLPLVGGLAVLGVYVGAATAPLVGVTLLASVGIDSWRSLGGYTGCIERVAAAVMVAAGVGQLYLSVFVLDVL